MAWLGKEVGGSVTDELSRLEPMIETVGGMREIVFDQTRQIDRVLHLLAIDRDGEASLPTRDPEVFSVIRTMIHMAGISGHSVLKLTEEIGLGVKDAYPIARGIIEGVINVTYIMAKGRETAARASRHAEVKAYRDLKREWEAGGNKMAVGWVGSLRAAEIARLDAMLPEFTTAKGRERDWTNDTLKQRLDVVGGVFASTALISLNTSAFNIYRHASEVIHGSFFSARFFWGVTMPGRSAPATRDAIRLTLLDHQFSILSSVIFAYAGLVECFAAYVGQPELNLEVRATLRRLSELPAVAETLSELGDPTP